jgi:hypothetical protein
MRNSLKSLLGIPPLMFSVLTLPAHAQTTLPTPSTTGNGSVAPVTPPAGTDRSLPIANPTKPGATGSRVVPGDNSSMRGDRPATYEQKSGAVSR